MSSKGLEVIDHSVQLTHEWINELGDELKWSEPRHVLQLLRSVLVALRDHLPHEESADFAAQFPIMIRGMYYEGWRPAATPLSDRSREAFVRFIEGRLTNYAAYEGERDIAVVLRFLSQKVTMGEVNKVRKTLPSQIRALWPE